MNERDNWWALAEYEDALCPQCKRLRSVCADDERDWYPQRHVCWASAAQQVATRRFHEINKDAEPDGAGYLPTDGSWVWVAEEDLTPDDEFLMSSIDRLIVETIRSRPRDLGAPSRPTAG